MTYYTSWEEFVKDAESLYLNDPMKVSTMLLCTHYFHIVAKKPYGVVSVTK